ncbi:hypothetical protein FHT21_004200 [Pedobacter sp. SG908]|nr:hypothetical protein [Pedobacter sp. SG908]
MILRIFIYQTVSSRKDTIYNHLILRKFNLLNIVNMHYQLMQLNRSLNAQIIYTKKSFAMQARQNFLIKFDMD